MKLVKTLPMPPYPYQTPDWLKPRRWPRITGISSTGEVMIEKPRP